MCLTAMHRTIVSDSLSLLYNNNYFHGRCCLVGQALGTEDEYTVSNRTMTRNIIWFSAISNQKCNVEILIYPPLDYN